MRPLLYIDLLGFSEFALANDLATLKDFYLALMRDLSIFDSHGMGLEVPIKFELLSDSLFIWIDDQDVGRNFKLLTRTASVLLHNFLAEKQGGWARYGYFRPVRGSLCIETYEIQQNHFLLAMRRDEGGNNVPVLKPNFTILGRAIPLAAKWEAHQDWVGISIPFSNVEQIQKIAGPAFDDLVSKNYLVKYAVPTKSGPIETYAINPLAEDGRHFAWLKGTMQKAKADAVRVNDFTKYLGTQKFLEHVEANQMYNAKGYYAEIKKLYQ